MDGWEDGRGRRLPAGCFSHTHTHTSTRASHSSQLMWPFSLGGCTTATSCDGNRSCVANKVVYLLHNLVSFTTATSCLLATQQLLPVTTTTTGATQPSPPPQPGYLQIQSDWSEWDFGGGAKGSNRKPASVPNCLHRPAVQNLIGSAQNATEDPSNLVSISGGKVSSSATCRQPRRGPLDPLRFKQLFCKSATALHQEP